MRRACWIAAVVLLLVAATPGRGLEIGLDRINRGLAGRLVDHTRNHGADRRIWSAALNEPRDLYVYLPPGFDPHACYPVLIWLHGVGQDERAFIREGSLEA